jgi:transcriptional regulator with XRE-family HTH domain
MERSVHNTKIGYLFKMAREWQGIKQKELSAVGRVTTSALSQFESGKSSLATETLLAMASRVNLNPDYIRGKSKNPFRSKELVKMLLQARFGLLTDFSMVYLIVSANPKIELMLLSPRSLFDKVFSKTVFETPIYAIVIRDSNNNLFLFRSKVKHVSDTSIEGGKDLIVRLQEIADKEHKKILFSIKRIDKDLYDKIKDWKTVARKDIEPLFQVQAHSDFVLTDSEEKLILLLRGKNIDPDQIIASLSDSK